MEIERAAEGPAFAPVMVSGTTWDDCIVCVFCTCSSTVVGVARLLLPTVLESVLESTTVVERGAPFQRMADCDEKFVPVTLMVMD